jgi:hypothetical protein
VRFWRRAFGAAPRFWCRAALLVPRRAFGASLGGFRVALRFWCTARRAKSTSSRTRLRRIVTAVVDVTSVAPWYAAPLILTENFRSAEINLSSFDRFISVERRSSV